MNKRSTRTTHGQPKHSLQYPLVSDSATQSNPTDLVLSPPLSRATSHSRADRLLNMSPGLGSNSEVQAENNSTVRPQTEIQGFDPPPTDHALYTTNKTSSIKLQPRVKTQTAGSSDYQTNHFVRISSSLNKEGIVETDNRIQTPAELQPAEKSPAPVITAIDVASPPKYSTN